MNTRKRILTGTVLALGLALHGPMLSAEGTEVTDFGEQVPTTDDFIAALTPAKTVKYRSLNPQAQTRKSASLRIQFKRDSSELTAVAQDTLNRLGGALVSQNLKQYRFRIEGHTDASGSETYNLDLSERRARSVKNYLAMVFGIEAVRLEEVGKGESELVDATNPNNPANRRVQIINLGQ